MPCYIHTCGTVMPADGAAAQALAGATTGTRNGRAVAPIVEHTSASPITPSAALGAPHGKQTTSGSHFMP